MPQRPFRFLHAADLRLDAAMEGLPETPAGLADVLIDCPLRSAARVFDAAIDQQVDFVVFAGGVLDPNRTGPREWLFLIEQFQRLADRNIRIYWSLSFEERVDLWPQFFQPPSNVKVFSAGRTERIRHEQNGTLVAELIGASQSSSGLPRAYEFAASDAGAFSIAVAHADWSAAALGEIGVDYWALGGLQQRSTPAEQNGIVHFPGSPQGRRPGEPGPHGCTIVSVDDRRASRLNTIACDVVRWVSPRLSLAHTAGEVELETALSARACQLADESDGAALLVDWKIDCGESLRRSLRHGLLARTLELKLRDEFGRRKQPIWTARVDAEAPQEMPKVWREEETIRGDFLRLTERYRIDAPPNVDLPALIGLDELPSELSESDDSLRRLLPKVAWLGASLLSPEEAVR